MNLAVNYFSIIVSAVLFMIVGTLWYGPFFGKIWMKLVKKTNSGMAPLSIVLVLVTAFITSWVLAVLLKTLLITTPIAALTLAAYAWLGFIATTLLHRVLFERGSILLYVINAAYGLVTLLLGSLVLVLWPW
jgi:hypothetical protein